MCGEGTVSGFQVQTHIRALQLQHTLLRAWTAAASWQPHGNLSQARQCSRPAGISFKFRHVG